MLEREIITWSQLNHPNILRLIGLYHQGADVYLVSPFAENGALPGYLVKHPDTNRIRFVSYSDGNCWVGHPTDRERVPAARSFRLAK